MPGRRLTYFIFCLTLLIVIPTLCLALYEDQVGMHDWNKQYIGRVKFAVFQTAGQRKRVYVATEKNVLAALNLRTGDIAWRHVYGPNDAIDALQICGKYVVTLSGGGLLVRAWTIADGSMVWDTTIATNPKVTTNQPVDFVIFPADASGSQDIAILAGGNIQRISGRDGRPLWSSTLQSGTILSKLHVASSHRLYVASTLGSPTVAPGFTVTELNSASGEELATRTAVVSGGPETGMKDFFFSDDTIVAIDSSSSAILTARISLRQLTVHRTKVSSLRGAGETAELLPVRLNGAVVLSSGGKALLVQVGPAEGALRVVLEFQQPTAVSDSLLLEGESGKEVLGVVQHVGPGVGTRISFRAVLADSGKDEGSEEVLQLAANRGIVQRVFLNSYTRKGSSPYGFRALVVAEDDSLSLIQQGEVVWVREEALASVVDVRMVDFPVAADNSQVAALEQSLVDWFKGQWLRAKATVLLATPEELMAVKEARLNGPAKSALTRDHKGFRKLILVLTQPGKLLGLHTGSGRIVWSLLASSLRAEAGAAAGRPLPLQLVLFQDPHRRALVEAPVVLVIGRQSASRSGSPGVLTWVHAHSGKELQSAQLSFSVRLVVQLPIVDSSEHRLLLLVDSSELPRVQVLPGTQEALELLQTHKASVFFHIVDATAGTITGYAIGNQLAGEEFLFSSIQVWQVVFPVETEIVSAVASPRPDEAVQTQVKVLGNREVMFKYLSRNLVFVGTSSPPGAELPSAPEETMVVAYIIDTVTGRVLHRVKHPDMQGPVHAVFAENWVVYHYFNVRSQRYETTILELYDDSRQPDAAEVAKYVLGVGPSALTAPTSAWSPPKKLRVLSQSYFFTHSVKAMTVTRSQGGITGKELLIGTVADQILALDKRFLDPRRTPTPTQQEREEGIPPYVELLPINPAGYLTHAIQVEGLRAILSEPTRLESTTHVFAYGVDLFYMRLAPFKMYDSLSDDFSYVLLLATIGALLLAILVTWLLSERKELQNRWK